MKVFFQKLLGATPWKKEWQEALTHALEQAQKGLGVSMIVVIARESDLYAEALFLLSFLGLAIGSGLAHLGLNHWVSKDLISLPVLGFALGSTLFAFRRFFINKIAPRAIRDRVAGRAKSLFFDHDQHLKGKLALLYFSELEKEALFLSSPELADKTPAKEVQEILSRLITRYDAKSPMASLGPAIAELGDVLRIHYDSEHDTPIIVGSPLYVGASDRPLPFQVPILKGSKDVN